MTTEESVIDDYTKVSTVRLDIVQQLLDIGISLSAEHNLDRLLEKIVNKAITFTNADGATLYLLRDEKLHFAISRNISLGLRIGGPDGDRPTFPPVPLNPSFISAYAAIHKRTISVPDVYQSEEFDFTGPKRFDEWTGYRSVSVLVTPLTDHDDQVIGVLQLINATDRATGKIIPFHDKFISLARSLASQAAVAIRNTRLLEETQRLFESFLEVMATALDARSKYTHGHVKRVAGLALELAQTINEIREGVYADINFSEDEINELRIAAWMHDVGKIVSPQHVMDKSTKLETIFDRAALISTRYDFIREQAKNEYLQKEIVLLQSRAPQEKIDHLQSERDKKLEEIEEEKRFVLACNNPGEFMEDAKIERLRKIAESTYHVNGTELPRVTEEEFENLSIRKGSLTTAERQIMMSHIDVTINMLDKIPFSSKLKNAPLYAGSHHECLDGSGYPKGLTAERMPLQSRILALVDFFEALTAVDRPYKKPMPLEKAYSILQSEVDKGKLDGNILNVLREGNVYQRFMEKEMETEAKATGEDQVS